MSDTEKIEKLEKDLYSITKKYELLLGEFENIFKHYEEGYKIAKNTLTSIQMKDLFLPNYINSLFGKMEESSQKIRNDAVSGKIEFDEIRNDVSISNYKELVSSSEETKERIKHITDNLIYTDVQNNYEEILKIIADLKIQESSVIIKKNLETGNWKVINTEDSSVIYEGQVNYKI